MRLDDQATNRQSGKALGMGIPSSLDETDIPLNLVSGCIALAIQTGPTKDMSMNQHTFSSIAAGATRDLESSTLTTSAQSEHHRSLTAFGGDEDDKFTRMVGVYSGMAVFGGALGQLVFSSTTLSNTWTYIIGALLLMGITWASTENLKNL